MIDFRKYQIVHRILALRDETVLNQIENWLANLLSENEVLPAFVKPLQKTISLEALQKAQNYVTFHFDRFSSLCQTFETEESTEELLAML